MKQDRSKYLKPEPIKYITRDFKRFDNAEDFYRFVRKHINKFIYSDNEIVGRMSGVQVWIPKLNIHKFFKSKQELYDFKLPEDFGKVHFSCDIKRIETDQEVKSRMLGIKTLQQYPTSYLLKQKIKCRGSMTGYVMLAILDTREHITNSAERKKIRQEKAKKQRNFS